MFPGFAHLWTPVALGRDLGAAPLSLKVAGEPLVLFRDQSGQPRVLIDRCPHRGVALSLGRVEGGCLRCPFHGWRFDGEGQCMEVPWHPEARRELLGATALPAREVGGLVWVYTAQAAPAGCEPQPPAELLRRDVVLTGSTFTWRAHWTRAVENMVDDAHLPFVHPQTIGRGLSPSSTARLSLDIVDEPWGWSWHAVIDGKRAEWAAELRWPNVSLLRIPAGRDTLGICFAAVPVDDDSVRVLQLSYRNMLRPALFHPVFRYINRRVLTEDQAIVESSPRGPVPRPHEESSVGADAIGLRFRKRYFADLAASAARLVRPGRQVEGAPEETRDSRLAGEIGQAPGAGDHGVLPRCRVIASCRFATGGRKICERFYSRTTARVRRIRAVTIPCRT
jgi:nitrite reductase/ring-hydroxylating ferredoxin subunit